MTIPNLLSQHIEKLRNMEHDIEVIDGNEIGLIFKSFPIPKTIWSCDKVDLLVVAFPSYPNSKLDMFWVIPTITLNTGKLLPKAADKIENKFGKEWQRFSWHVKSWNPAYDNLITYLDVVRTRLNTAE